MEIIDAGELTPGPGQRTVLVAHSRTGLRRGLDFGETVLLRAEDGEFHVARVTDITFELDDTVYTCELGGRIPEELARERAAGVDPLRDDLELHEIVDLLHDLREQGHRPPETPEPPESVRRELALS
jgi:hypothetical protein